MNSEYFEAWSALSEKIPPTETEVPVDGRRTSRRVERGKFCYLKNKKLDTCGGREKLGKCQFTFCLMTILKETTVTCSKCVCVGVKLFATCLEYVDGESNCNQVQ